MTWPKKLSLQPAKVLIYCNFFKSILIWNDTKNKFSINWTLREYVIAAVNYENVFKLRYAPSKFYIVALKIYGIIIYSVAGDWLQNWWESAVKSIHISSKHWFLFELRDGFSERIQTHKSRETCISNNKIFQEVWNWSVNVLYAAHIKTGNQLQLAVPQWSPFQRCKSSVVPK